MNKRFLMLFSLIICGSQLSAGSDACESCKEIPKVTVQGQGKISAAPDRARIWVEVSEQGPQLEEVTQLVRRKISAVIKAIKEQGIAEKDVQTQSYQVAPRFDWSGGKQKRIGFTVSNRVQVVIHDLKKAGSVLSGVLDAGANGVNGPMYEFENPKALERQALQQAVQDAKAKAELIAKESGASIGKTLTISEGGVAFPMPRPMLMSRMALAAPAAASPPEPIEAGEENITANVSATFELR